MRAGQRQEQPGAPRHAVEQPAAAHVGKQPDGDLGHGHARGLADHAVAGAHHQAHAAAHDDAMAPAQHRLGVGVDQVVQPVLVLEEAARMGIGPGIATGVLAHAAVQPVQVAAGAERLLARPLQDEHRHGRVGGPGAQARVEQLDHLERQAIEGLRRIERGHAQAHAIVGNSFFKQHGRIHRISAPFSSNCRATMTRMISFVPSRIWCTRVSRTRRSSG
ncbi:Uncharacterised protein [Bordetella pertussis]|nr:Uncharacterised protein [Bordetella pertussis]